MAFDFEGALKEGYSAQEISDHLEFDYQGAVQEGYSDEEIIQHLQGLGQKPKETTYFEGLAERISGPKDTSGADRAGPVIGVPEALGEMFTSIPAMATGVYGKGKALFQGKKSDEDLQAAADEATPQWAKDIIYHPRSKVGKDVSEGLATAFGKVIEAGGAGVENFTAGATFAQDPERRKMAQIEQQYADDLKRAEAIGKVGTEAAMLAPIVKGAAGLPKALQGRARQGVSPAIEAELRARKEAKQAVPERTQQGELFDETFFDRTAEIEAQRRTQASAELEGIYRDAGRFDPQRDMFYPEQRSVDTGLEMRAPRIEDPRNLKYEQTRPAEADPNQMMLEFAKAEEGIPFSREGKMSTPVEVAQLEKNLQQAIRDIAADKARLEELRTELRKTKTEIGPEVRMEIQAQMADLHKSVQRGEAYLARATQAGREIGQLRVQTKEGVKQPYQLQENIDLSTPKSTYTTRPAPVMEAFGKKKGKGKSPREVFGKKQGGAINPEVFKEGFEKVKKLANGLSLKARPSGFGPLYIEATTKEGKRAGQVIFDPVKNEFGEFDLVSTDTGVRPDFQRQGIASEMYKFAAELGNDVVASAERTPEGKAMWDGLERKGISREGVILGRSQRGSFSPFSSSKDKTLVKQYKTLDNFLKSVPEELRAEATEMWREQGGQVQIVNAKAEALSDIPGVKEKLKYMLDPEDMSYDAAKQKLAGVADISEGQLRNNVMSAGQMMSQFFKNDAITWSIGMIKTNAEQARIRVRDIESDIKVKIASVKKVGNIDQLIEVTEALATGKEPKDLGPKAVELLETIRKHNDSTYKLLNEEFKQATGRELPKRENYFTHSWTGPWGFEVYALNERGQPVLIDVIRERTKGEAKKALEWVSSNKGDLQIGEIKYNSKFDTVHAKQDVGFIEESIQQMLNLSVEGSAKAKEAQTTFRDHFKLQTGVGGYLGNKPWKAPRENMADAFDSFNSYTSAATQWAYGKKAQRELNKFIEDKDMNVPNAKALAQEYYGNAFGRNKQLVEGLDSLTDFLARKTGSSKATIHQAVRNNKAMLTLLTLAYNMRFLGTQMIQPLQTVVPKMLEMSAVSGNKAAHHLNFLLGMADGVTTLTPKKLGVQGAMTKEGKMLYDFAQKNHIIDPRVVEHLEGFSKTDKARFYLEEGLAKPNRKAEEATRLWAFSTLYRTAKDLGMSDKDALNLAKNQVQTTMVSYELADRPLMYGKLGIAGETASNLRTYSHNQYTTLIDYYKTGKHQGEWAPFVAQVGTQAALAGASGFFGYQEIEAMWDLIKRMDAVITGGQVTKDIPSMTEAMLNNAPDWVTFGGISGITGYDLGTSMTASGIMPDSAQDFLFPLLTKEIDMIHSGFNALKSWDNKEDWGVFLEKSLPVGLKGQVEKHLLTRTLPDGKQVKVKSAIDPSKRFAEVDDPTDGYYKAKTLGTKTLELSKMNKLKFEDVKAEAQLREVLTGLETKVLKNIDAKNPDAVGAAFKKFVEMGGDEQALRNKIESHVRKGATADPYGQLMRQGDRTADQLRNKRILDRFAKQRAANGQ